MAKKHIPSKKNDSSLENVHDMEWGREDEFSSGLEKKHFQFAREDDDEMSEGSASLPELEEEDNDDNDEDETPLPSMGQEKDGDEMDDDEDSEKM